LRIRSISLLIALIAAGLTACGETNPVSLAGREDVDPSLISFPSFENDIQEIIDRVGCSASTCHGVGQGGLFFGLDPRANYEALVDVRSTLEPQFLLVERGDPDNSYMVVRLENRANPLFPEETGTPIGEIDLTNIRTWIEQGARF